MIPEYTSERRLAWCHMGRGHRDKQVIRLDTTTGGQAEDGGSGRGVGLDL